MRDRGSSIPGETSGAAASRAAGGSDGRGSRPSRRDSGLALAIALLTAGVAPDHAQAQSGLQITPDGTRTMISKDVGDQRWAITYDARDGSVTGNVFFPGGGDPSFVYCERIGDDGNPDPAAVQIRFRCLGNDRCASAPCDPATWEEIATVDLAGSFFLPPAPSQPAVPTTPAELFAWLQSGAYRSFAAESGPHPSDGPHGGGVRTFINAILDESLAAGRASHPVGAAAVKELLSGGSQTLTGWAVEVKTQPDSAGGNGWYWYEVFSTTDGSRPIAGQGNPTCTGCHASGRDYVRIPYPLQ